MIVKFMNNFHAPGFGRNRFPSGIVRDVPDSMRNKLPKSAEIMADDLPTDEQLAQEQDTRAAHDFARSSSDTSDEALGRAGYAGWADENGPPDKTPEPWMFNGQEYKTEAAMKAAITRERNKT